MIFTFSIVFQNQYGANSFNLSITSGECDQEKDTRSILALLFEAKDIGPIITLYFFFNKSARTPSPIRF